MASIIRASPEEPPMLWPVLLALALTLSPADTQAQVDCASLNPAEVQAYLGYIGAPLDTIRDQSRVLQAQAVQLSTQPVLLTDRSWLTTVGATAASLRTAGLALQQYPSVPPALQGTDTLLRSAGGHLVGAMDDWTGGLAEDDEEQLLGAVDGLMRALAELTAAVPALEGVVDCFVP
jgi:hypothetical protein